MKKLFVFLLMILLCLAFVLPSFAKGEMCQGWFIKRRGNLRPEFPSGASELEKLGVYFIDEKYPDKRAEKKLYLTFDAGYENGNVEKILDVLKNEGVPGAFFLLDNIIIKNPELIKRMEKEGHLVCNHTKNHKNLSFSTKEEIERDLLALEEICFEKTGVKMAKYFRFPEGKYSKEAIKAVYELGFKTVFWSFAYEDWDNNKQMDPGKATQKILKNTHNGAIILLHPTSATNAEILPTLIKEWRKMGYSFGSLEEL